MPNKIISQGSTTNEAIENGLKQLSMTKNMVDIKVLEEEKRSFFSILAPRIVKVELTVKEDSIRKEERVRRDILLSEEEQQKAKDNIDHFMQELLIQLPENTTYQIELTKEGVKVALQNEKLGYLIGYRGETLYAMQNVFSAVAGKGIENKVRVILDIEGYKAKRDKTLQELAEKMAKTVIKTKKPITLEPMQAYERKIIHSKLQENDRIETKSIGEEPHRRIIISLKNT